jgi:hypothetical protein
VVEVALRKEAWNHSCLDFDGAILLDGTTSGTSMSTAYFPPSLGGTTMQLYQSMPGLWGFSNSGNGTSVSYDFRNGTYSLSGVKSESGSFYDSPLSFPELNLTSQGQWIGSCFQPGVTLKDARGDIVVQTGLGAYGDCKQMKVCARTTLGVDAVVIAVGRILIALQGAASCCGQSRWGQ